MITAELLFNFFIGGIVVSAAWAGISLILIYAFQLKDPRGRAIILVAPLVAAFVARVRLADGLEWAIVFISIGVAVLLFIKDVCCYHRASALVRKSCHIRDQVQAIASRLAEAFNTATPKVLISASVARPFTSGTLCPVIVLPEPLLHSLSEPELTVLLAHEMAHIKRRDFFTKWVLLFITRLSWMNPIATALYRRIGFEMECASDELASQKTGKPGTLARTLLKTERLVFKERIDHAEYLMMSACSFLEARIKLLAESPPAKFVALKVSLILGVFAPICFKVVPLWLTLTSFLAL